MKKISKQGKIAIISVSALIAAFLIYALVCAGITFIPMLQMTEINKTANGSGLYPTETIVLESDAKLHVFPSNAAKNKYVIVCPGGGYVTLSKGSEGYNIAGALNRMGYTAFVLEYRVASQITEFQGPLDDLAYAIRYVDENAKKYNVYKGLYALCGFSAGGNLVGLFGTEEYGYCNYEDIEKPNAIIMGYPWCNPTNEGAGLNFVKKIYFDTINSKGAEVFLGSDKDLDPMRVPLWVTEDYPRTFIMHGDSDSVIPAESNSDLLAAKLEEMGVDYVYKKCPGVNHGCGLGIGTSAEGWIEEAMAFADEKWYEDKFEPDVLDAEQVIQKAGGFVAGVCHPNDKVEEVKELGADWVRIDMPILPYLANGEISPYYDYFKQDVVRYATAGLKVFLVTPYPSNILEYNELDSRIPEDMIIIKKAHRYLFEDLSEYVSAWQITNELSEPQFRAPLTAQEAADYLYQILEATYRYRGNALLGFNLSATDILDFPLKVIKCAKYCDYVGFDLYLGCFEKESGTYGFGAAHLGIDGLAAVLNRPILLTEFGYLSAGERMSDADKLDLLHKYGAEGSTVAEAEYYAATHVKAFIEDEDFPVRLRERLELICKVKDENGRDTDEVDYSLVAASLFGGNDGWTISYAAHLYMELDDGVMVVGYPHTLEGQANYFRDFFDEVVVDNSNIVGAIVYCFSDSERCYVCGQENCPVETGWGLLDGHGNKKPSFDSVKEAFARTKEIKNVVLEENQ